MDWLAENWKWLIMTIEIIMVVLGGLALILKNWSLYSNAQGQARSEAKQEAIKEIIIGAIIAVVVIGATSGVLYGVLG